MTPRGLGGGRLRLRRTRSGASVWQLDYTDHLGRRRRIDAGRTKVEAELRRAEIIHDRGLRLSGQSDEADQERSCDEVMEEYLGDLISRATDAYVEETRRTLKRIFPEIRARSIGDIHMARVVAWRGMRAREVAAKTANDDVGKIRAFAAWCAQVGYLNSNPLLGIGCLPANPVRPARALSEDEIGRLLAACESLDTEHPNWIPRFTTVFALIATGARWNELRQVRWEDLNEVQGFLTLRAGTTKGRKGRRSARSIPLDADFLEVLKRARVAAYQVLGRIPSPKDTLLLSPKGKPWTQQTANLHRYLTKALAVAKIPKVDVEGGTVHVHALRHTFATRLARAGVPIQKAMNLMGHVSERMLLQIYTHLETEDTREAIEMLPSLGITGSKLATASDASATDSTKKRPWWAVKVAPRTQRFCELREERAIDLPDPARACLGSQYCTAWGPSRTVLRTLVLYG